MVAGRYEAAVKRKTLHNDLPVFHPVSARGYRHHQGLLGERPKGMLLDVVVYTVLPVQMSVPVQGSSEVFYRKVKFWDGDGQDAPPVFHVDGVNYLHVKVSCKRKFELRLGTPSQWEARQMLCCHRMVVSCWLQPPETMFRPLLFWNC